MKFGTLFIGLLLGAALGFGITSYLNQSRPNEGGSGIKDDSPAVAKWTWPDSLDALKAAPANHKVVYEDSNVRVLAVILDGKKAEPIHTHKWKSIMWIAKPIVPCLINNYKKGKNGELLKTDSLLIKEMPVNMGQMIDPEGPTSITNLGNESGVAYRVEFKKDFK